MMLQREIEMKTFQLQNGMDLFPEKTVHLSAPYTGTLAVGRFFSPVFGNLAQLHPTLALRQQRRRSAQE